MNPIHRHCLSSALLVLIACSTSACQHSQAADTEPAPVLLPDGIMPSMDLRGASDDSGAAVLGATDTGPSHQAAGVAPDKTGGDGTP